MRQSKSRIVSAVVLSLAVGWGVAGCSSDDPTDPGAGAGSAVVGSWRASSFIADGNDLIAAGMSFVFTFDASGGYVTDIKNDQGGLCEVGSDCLDTGDYTATATTITLDPGTTDAVVLNYTISGTTMTVTATIDGMPVTVTLNKT